MQAWRAAREWGRGIACLLAATAMWLELSFGPRPRQRDAAAGPDR